MQNSSLIAIALTLIGAHVFGGLNDGLLAYYPLNNDANDASGNNNNGTPYYVTPTADRFGRSNSAYYFNGTSSYIAFDANPLLAVAGDFSLSAWVKSTRPSGWQGIVSYDTSGTYGYGLCLTSDGIPSVWIGNGTTWGYAKGNTSIRGNATWTHLAAVRRVGLTCIYINGILQTTNTSHSVAYANSRLCIARHSGSDQYFGGALDEIRIYNRALTAGEIGQLYTFESHVQSVAITQPTSINSGAARACTCIANFSGGETRDVSTEAKWMVYSSALPPGTYINGNTLVAGSASTNTTITIKAEYTHNRDMLPAVKQVAVVPKFWASIVIVEKSHYILAKKWIVKIAASTDGPNGHASSLVWNLSGAGNIDEANGTATFEINEGGTRLIGLTASDSSGAVANAWRYITLGKPIGSGEGAVPEVVTVMEPGFFNATGGVFSFDAGRINNGLLVITHGIYAAATNTWVTNMAQRIAQRLVNSGKPLPNIVLYDWSAMSDPDKFRNVGEQGGQGRDFIDDLILIRTYGIAQGQVLADWISKNVAVGNVLTNKPIHIIGHSAGGFVAGNCASILGKEIKQITMLDTPLPYSGVGTKYLHAGGLAEHYITSFGGFLTLQHKTWAGIYADTWYWLDDYLPEKSPPLIEGHSWVHEWYTSNTVVSALDNGFYYSPFMGNGFHGYNPSAFRAMLAAQTLDVGSDLVPITEFATFGSVVNAGEVYTVTEENNAGLTKELTLPVGVQTVRFRYQFTTPGDGDFIAVHWGTNEADYVGLDLANSRGRPIEAFVDLSSHAGETASLMIKLVSRSNQNAVVVIDGIQMEVSDDPDGDGLSNDQEAALGTEPLRADTDGDGLADGDEVNVYHTNPLRKDSDGDGMNDDKEIACGTNPGDRSDVFALTDIRYMPGVGTRLCWPSVAGKRYDVLKWTNITDQAYATLTNGVVATVPTNTVIDASNKSGACFYWLRITE